MPTFETSDFTLVDPTDQTKQLKLDVSALTTSTLVTLVVPGFAVGSTLTIATLEAAQDFTGVQTFSGGASITGGAFATSIQIQNNVDGVGLYVDQRSGGSQTSDLVQVRSASGATKYWKLNYRGNHVDTFFYTCYASDDTARFRFDASGISTATDRTLTVPDADGSILLRETVVCYNDAPVCFNDELVTTV